MLNISIYKIMEESALYLIVWIGIFFALSLSRIALNIVDNKKAKGYGSLISELPGLPLIFMHTVAFIKAVELQDYSSALLFVWWGPGFFIFAAVYLYGKLFKKKINWAPFGLITSYACKVNYVIFMAIYWHFDCPLMLFTFSAWIICDQINLAYFLNTGDRTRRTFEDYWILRIMYPGFLFVPFFYTAMPNQKILIMLGGSLFITWLLALYSLYKKGLFFRRYTNPDYLRNIVYLSKCYRKKSAK